MNQDPIDALTKQRQITIRAHTALAAIEISLDDLMRWRNERRPRGRVDSPSEVLRGILLDLFDGCWDSGFSAGQDQQDPSTGA